MACGTIVHYESAQPVSVVSKFGLCHSLISVDLQTGPFRRILMHKDALWCSDIFRHFCELNLNENARVDSGDESEILCWRCGELVETEQVSPLVPVRR